VGHELLDGPTAVIPCDVGVQLAPEALNGVLLWTVRREEVEENDPWNSSSKAFLTFRLKWAFAPSRMM